MFRGTQWSQIAQTCAYDSILTILSNVYFHHAQQWQESMTGVSQMLGGLVTEWSKVLQHASFERLESIRDALQAKLNSQDADSFPKSGGHTDLGALMIKLFRDESKTQTQHTHKCNSCTRTEQWLSKTHNWTLPVEVAQNTVVFQP